MSQYGYCITYYEREVEQFRRSYYNQRWEECINELAEQIDDEGLPALERSSNPVQMMRLQNAKKSDVEWFQFYGTLYIKYVDIYRKLEDCYDQLTHPQKRQLLKEMLTNTMIRMCEIKQVASKPTQKVVKYSTHSQVVQSEFINFDDLVMDLKLTPKCLEVPIPRYFAEEDRKKLDQRNGMIKQLMEQMHDTCEPEQEMVVDSLQLETNSQTAVRIIQKLQRGRQGIGRALEAFKFRKAMLVKRKMSLEDEEPEEDKQNRMSIILQKYIRAYAARYQFSMLRDGELTFLGIMRQYEQNSVWKTALENRQHQKKIQQQNEQKLAEDKERIRQEIRMAEGGNMRERMLQERRNWIKNYLFMSDFRLLPSKPSSFYKIQNEQLDKEETSPKKKKAAQQDPSPKKKAKPKVIINDDNAVPSQLVVKLQDNIQQHGRQWRQREQIEGEPYKVQMLKNKIRPDVELQIQNMVDAMIGLELDNMRIKYGIRKRKEKRKKKAKKKKAKKIKIPLGLGKRSPKELLAHLVELKVVKILKPAHMNDFKGETNPLGSLQERLAELEPDPSYAQLREVIIEGIAIPLGSSAAKQRLDKKSWFLFYGPSGAGKTLVIRAIQTECNCMVIDLSPDNIQGKFTDKKDLKRIFWSSIIVAKHYQPTIVLVEDVETILQPKKKKKKQHFFGVKLRRSLTQMKKNKLWQKTDRIAVIGCSNRPYNGDLKTLKKMFHKHYYFPYPNYATRKLLFKQFLTERIGRPLQDFPYGTVSQISEGFTSGSYKQAIERVVTEGRVKRMASEPLKLAEFILPLSNTYCTYSEQYEKLKKFTDEVTGNRQRREQKSKLQLVDSTKKKGGKR